MSDEEQISKLIEICSQSNHPDEILSSLDELRDLQSSNKITLSRRLEAQLQAFDNLRTLFQNEPKTPMLEKTILEYLIPDCLRLDEFDRYLIHQHRDVLNKWLNELDDADRNVIRTKVYKSILPLLETSTHHAVCWVISNIGFRDDEVAQRLWKVVRKHDNDTGDIALSTITLLGIPESERDNILKELTSRATRRYNNHLLWGIARVGDPSSVPIVLNLWLSSPLRVEWKVDASLAFTAICEIVDANDGNHELQDKLWTQAAALVEELPKTLYQDFAIGHITTQCNSPHVIPTLITWHGQHADWFENPTGARFQATGDLENCIKPRQLEGWSLTSNNPIFSLLRNDACLNTKFDGFASTIELMTKEKAWKTLLRSGYQEALSWFDPAVTGEDGRFARSRVMEYLACFRFDPLPETIAKWITEVYDDPGNQDGRELSFRMAAVRMARSTATEEAFEYLLNFGFTYKGLVITQSSDAVSEVALNLVRQGNTSIVDRLVGIVAENSNSRQRMVSAHGLEVIASLQELHKSLLTYTESFISLVYDESRDQIERGLLLDTLGHLTEWVIPDSMLNDLISWAQKPDRWIGKGSLQILANLGHLEKHPELMRDILALEQDGKQWQLTSNEIRFEWAPYIIGLLYNRNPEAYAPVFASQLANPDWAIPVQITRWLDATHGHDGQPDLPNVIVEAMIHRVYERNSSAYGETGILDVLARLAPNAMVEHRWDQVVTSWISDTRLDLADALGKAKIGLDKKEQCLSALQKLAGDSIYAVRRAAYRGLAKQSPQNLYSLCMSWMDSGLLSLNMRAAEACGWLENTVDKLDAFDVVYQRCKNHPEINVREAATRSWEERRRRLWAREYLTRLINLEGKDNSEILRNWCYGDALSQVGDDECAEILHGHLSHKPLPPNVRYWIKHILEELEKNWRQTTQKWPEPWVDMRGAIENGSGKLILGPNKTIDVQYSVWRVPASSPDEKHSWGGMLSALSEPFLNFRTAIVELDGKRQGEIILRGSLNNMVTFQGTGKYPEGN
ncbi:hypothetical protein BROC_01635 [Candidatus Brocadiaceae bacterium]|nr:hypothetical protein BROC_01635 [Candidatus Brocadiaceae bacterium]